MEELLIVPYGIETADCRCCVHIRILLIVPYGIETADCRCCVHIRILLIVPYGIETAFSGYGDRRRRPFNRTLWN